jgi:hypothetical protein
MHMPLDRRTFVETAAVTGLVGTIGIAPVLAQNAQSTKAEGGLMDTAVIAPPRTWEELKTEVQARTDRQIYPMTGMRSEDVRVILGRINSLDRNQWGKSWSEMAREWMSKGDNLAGSDRQAASDAYIMAWRYASFGGWPIAISPEKKASYAASLKAFMQYGQMQKQKIERIEIPFESSQIVFLLQLPKSDKPAPVIVSIGGLDSYKEYVAERYGPVYMKHSIGYAAVDAPNTGEARIPERSEHFDDADRGQADIADRSRCSLDGHKWPR